METVDRYEQYDELFLELEKARLVMLQADSAVAEAKREFHEGGVSLRASELHALYAAQNAAGIKVQEIKIRAMKAKQDAKKLKGKTFAALLTKKLEEADMEHLIAEAQAESLQAVKDAGLHTAYSSRGQ